ncbi:MAG: CBS domain-containing protein [Burkholderiales bacterium]|nr:CBS domain-containing protein [Burkholderiales bacterium]
MFGQEVRQLMHGEPLLTATPQTDVHHAACQMAGSRASAVVVVDGDRVAGIFTERDAVLRVIAQGLEPRQTPLAAVMTENPVTTGPGCSLGQALTRMHQLGIRHLPVVEEGRLVGMITARDALDPDLEEFVCEVSRRQGFGG